VKVVSWRGIHRRRMWLGVLSDQAGKLEVTKVSNELKRFFEDESGPELVEWAVVTVILILASFATYQLIGQQLTRILNRILEALQSIGE